MHNEQSRIKQQKPRTSGAFQLKVIKQSTSKDRNNGNALYYVGEYYKSVNDNRYIMYIKKGAEMNNNNALYSLSQFYKEINKNDDYLKYIKLSAIHGNKDAVNEIYDLAIKSKEDENIDIYINLLQFSAKYGNKNAESDLNDYNQIQNLRNTE